MEKENPQNGQAEKGKLFTNQDDERAVVFTELDKQDIHQLNYTIAQLLAETLQVRLGKESDGDTSLTADDIGELAFVLQKLNRMESQLPEWK